VIAVVVYSLFFCFPLHSCAMTIVDVKMMLGTFLIFSARKSSSAGSSGTVTLAIRSYSP